MSAVATLAVFMKKHVLGQSMIRRNPYFYDRSLAALGQGKDAGFEERLAWSDEQVRRTLALAQRTGYGRSAGGGLELHRGERAGDCADGQPSGDLEFGTHRRPLVLPVGTVKLVQLKPCVQYIPPSFTRSQAGPGKLHDRRAVVLALWRGTPRVLPWMRCAQVLPPAAVSRGPGRKES